MKKIGLFTLALFLVIECFSQLNVNAKLVKADSLRARVDTLNLINLGQYGITVNDTLLETYISAKAGSSISFGGVGQIPHMNSSMDDFDYTSELSYLGGSFNTDNFSFTSGSNINHTAAGNMMIQNTNGNINFNASTLVDITSNQLDVGNVEIRSASIETSSGSLTIQPDNSGGTELIDLQAPGGVTVGNPSGGAATSGEINVQTGYEINGEDLIETGNWTPDITDGSTSATGTFTGSYVRVGEMVTVRAVCDNINTAGLTGGNTLILDDLPFDFPADDWAGVVQTDNVNYPANTLYYVCISQGSTNQVTFRGMLDNSSAVDLIVSDLNSGTSSIVITITYQRQVAGP